MSDELTPEDIAAVATAQAKRERRKQRNVENEYRQILAGARKAYRLRYPGSPDPDHDTLNKFRRSLDNGG